MNGTSPAPTSQAVTVESLIASIEGVLDGEVNYSAMEHMTDQFHDREEAIYGPWMRHAA